MIWLLVWVVISCVCWFIGLLVWVFIVVIVGFCVIVGCWYWLVDELVIGLWILVGYVFVICYSCVGFGWFVC